MSDWQNTTIILNALEPRTPARTDGDKWQVEKTVWLRKEDGRLADHLAKLTEASTDLHEAELKFWDDIEMSITGWRDATEDEIKIIHEEIKTPHRLF